VLRRPRSHQARRFGFRGRAAGLCALSAGRHDNFNRYDSFLSEKCIANQPPGRNLILQPMAGDLLTVAEVAELLKLNPQTIYNKIRDGSLPATKVGRGVRVRISDVTTLAGGDVDLLTVDEVAEILKMNQQTTRNWLDAGKLPIVRVGRRVRIMRADLNGILKAGSSGSVPDPGPTAEDFWLGNRPVGAPLSPVA
jgi:excisionase family DNA binding protein